MIESFKYYQFSIYWSILILWSYQQVLKARIAFKFVMNHRIECLNCFNFMFNISQTQNIIHQNSQKKELTQCNNFLPTLTLNVVWIINNHQPKSITAALKIKLSALILLADKRIFLNLIELNFTQISFLKDNLTAQKNSFLIVW